MRISLHKGTRYSIAFILVNLLLSTTAFAANFTSKISGNWNSTATWDVTVDLGNGNSDADGIPDDDDFVTILSGHTVIVNEPGNAKRINVYGILNIDYDLTMGKSGDVNVYSGGKLSFNSTAVIKGGSPNNNGIKITINDGAILETANPGGFSTSNVAESTLSTGSFRVNIGNFIPTYSTSANYIYNGTIPQVTGNALTNANNVIISNTSTTGVGVVTLSVPASITNLTIVPNSKLDVSASNHALSISGNLTNNGSFDARTGTVTLNGTTAAQTIGGSSATIFHNLTMNSTVGVSLNQDVNVKGVLTLINGQLTTTKDNLLTLTNTASVTGATNNSFVNGPITKEGINTEFIFPVGKNGKYVPIRVSASGSIPDVFNAEYFPLSGVALGPITSSGLVRVSECEYWDLNRISGGSNVNVTLFWDGDNACSGPGYITDPTSIVVANYAGPGWSTHSGLGTGTMEAGSVTWSSVPAFGHFTLGSTTVFNALPVHFSGVKAIEKSRGVQLEFTNLTESDVVYYEVERSADGKVFNAVKKLFPAKNNYGSVSYTYLDAAAQGGRDIYRIKAMETTGKIVYSSFVSITLGAKNNNLNVYASGGQVAMQISNLPAGKYQVQLFSAAGQLLSVENISHAGGSFSQTTPLNNAKGGIYIINITGSVHMQKRFIIQ